MAEEKVRAVTVTLLQRMTVTLPADVETPEEALELVFTEMENCVYRPRYSAVINPVDEPSFEHMAEEENEKWWPKFWSAEDVTFEGDDRWSEATIEGFQDLMVAKHKRGE